MHLATAIQETAEDGAVSWCDGDERCELEADAVVLATGVSPVDSLVEELAGKGAEVYVIGDAKSPRLAVEAIAEGAEVARRI